MLVFINMKQGTTEVIEDGHYSLEELVQLLEHMWSYFIRWKRYGDA